MKQKIESGTQETRNNGRSSHGETGILASRLKTTRRQRMFIRRALREENRGKRHFEKARAAVKLAMQNGLAVDQPVEIDLPAENGSKITEVYAIKDNFAGDVAFKRSFVSHYSLEKVPKYRRSAVASAEADKRQQKPETSAASAPFVVKK